MFDQIEINIYLLWTDVILHALLVGNPVWTYYLISKGV